MSGLELVGGVSAAFGLAQTAFSLAKAIRESAKDYKDARDDIAGLARVIESTLSQVTEVQGLIDDNDTTQVFSDNGINTIKNSFVYLERIVRDLIKLLTTAGVPEDTRKTIRPEDVAVTRFQKVGWIGLKSEVKGKKDELSKIQIDLTLAIICAQARSTVSPTVFAALRSRVVDLETQRRQHALDGPFHMTGKPNMLQSTADDPSGLSAPSAPTIARSSPASSSVSSVQGGGFLPDGDGGVPLGGNTGPISVNPTLLLDMQQIAPQQVNPPTGQHHSTDTGQFPANVDTKQPGKHNDRTQEPSDKPHRVQYAYLLVVGGVDPFVTPLMTPKHPKRLSRASPRATAQVWAAISHYIRDEIALTLDSRFPLPRGYGWHLAFAKDTETPPSWKRTLARLLHLYEDYNIQRSTLASGRCYTILFVSSQMFHEGLVSESPQTQAPVIIRNHIHKKEDAAVSSDYRPRMRVNRRHAPPMQPSSTLHGHQLYAGPRDRLQLDVFSSSSTGSSISRVHHDDNSTGEDSSRRREHYLETERRKRLERAKRLEHAKRESAEVREMLGEENKGKSPFAYYRYPHGKDDEKQKIELEVEQKQILEERERTTHEASRKSMDEETRTLEMMERRKREEAEEERRVLENIERRKRGGEVQERLQWAKFEETKAKEAAERKDAEKEIGSALRQRLIEADLSPSEIEKLFSKHASERNKQLQQLQQQQQSISIPITTERIPEEESQLFNDAMLRFTGRML